MSVLLAAAGTARAAIYTVTDLGTNVAVAGINNGGAMVGSNMVNHVAAVYGGAWTNLGTLGGLDSSSAGLNDSLQVVGSSANAASLTRAFLWTPGGTDGVPSNPQMKDLNTLGGSTSEASSINASGQVVGYAETSHQYEYHAFRYSGGTMTDIGALLPNPLGDSYAYSVNDAGHVAGEAYDPQWNPVAFFYNGVTATVMITLPGGHYASAYGINNADQVVGYSSTATGLEHAFLYVGGVITDLGTLGGNYSYANAINNNGVIVGSAGVTTLNDGLYHAFIYSGGPMTDLNTLLDASGNGWTLKQASDINDAGQIIGIGDYGTEVHAFLLIPLPQITQQPTNVTVSCQANATFSVTAAPAPLTYQWYKGNPPAGSAIGNGTNSTLVLSNVTSLDVGSYYAVVAGNSAWATSSVATLTIVDSTPPILSGCPGNITNYAAPGASTAVVTWPDPTAADNCDGAVPVVATPSSGSTFSLGVTTVTCVASDSSANTNTCGFTVTLLQGQAPTITGVSVEGVNVVLSFTTQEAAHYAIDYRQALATGSWDPLVSDIVGTGETLTVTHLGAATLPAGFYRVRLTLP